MFIGNCLWKWDLTYLEEERRFVLYLHKTLNKKNQTKLDLTFKKSSKNRKKCYVRRFLYRLMSTKFALYIHIIRLSCYLENGCLECQHWQIWVRISLLVHKFWHLFLLCPYRLTTTRKFPFSCLLCFTKIYSFQQIYLFGEHWNMKIEKMVFMVSIYQIRLSFL